MRKIKMWLLLVLTCLTLVGCDVAAEPADVTFGSSKSERFIYEQHHFNGYAYCIIITDTVTEKQYLFVKSGNGGGLTALEG